MITKADAISLIMNDIAPRYFDADEYSEITKSRIGLFGVTSETMGTIFENSVVNNAIKARNMLTITADRASLLREAAGYPDLVIPNAMPSSISMFLGVPVSYLKSRCMVDSSNIEFTLDSDTVFTISNIPFLLDYDLKIFGRFVDGKWVYSSQYIITGENIISGVVNPYLITTERFINTEIYVMVIVTLHQLAKSYSYYNIVETEAIPLNGIDFKYTGQLAYFNVYYKEAGSSTYTLLTKINYMSNATSGSKYVYYDISKLQYIRIFIPDSLGFKFNSELRLDIYTTSGAKGSFKYTSGAVEMAPKSFGDEFDYTGIYFSPIVISDSAGGKDVLTTEEIRNLIINYKSTLRSIDTENDLNIFFRSLDTVNNINFIKKRIDVFEKLYTAFMLLRDVNGAIISSNSLNAELHAADIDAIYEQTGRRIVKPTIAYSLKTGQDYIVAPLDVSAMTPTEITATEEDATKFLFASPYLMVINENPQSISYYLNSINRDNIMTIQDYNSEATVQFIINKINVARNAIAGEVSYTITTNIVPSSELPAGIVDADGNIIDDTIIKPYGYVYATDPVDDILHYFKFTLTSYNKTDKYFVATATLTTDDYITLGDKLRFTNSLYNAGEATASDIVVDINKVKLGIGVYYKSATITDKGSYVNIVPSMDNYGLVNVYTNKNDLTTFMINMSKKVKSVVTFVDEGGGAISFDIKQIPLIRYSELRNNIDTISDIIENTDTILSSMLTLMKNNCAIDYKFYATYGKSRYFTMENTTTKLDRLNIALKFRVRISASKTDIGLVTDLKNFIRPLVETANNLTFVNSTYFSNIITQVENEFRYTQNRILSCELTQVNSYTTLYQSIVNTTKPLENMTKAELLEYVAEFVTLDIDDITIDIIQV